MSCTEKLDRHEISEMLLNSILNTDQINWSTHGTLLGCAYKPVLFDVSQTQIVRYKEAVEKLSQEKEDLASRRLQTEEVSKRSQKQLRDLREEFTDTQRREMEASQRKQELVSVAL